MNLLDKVKKDRARHKEKKPYPESPWAVVAAIVQKFGLTAVPAAGEGGEPSAAPPGERLSLFPLLSAAQWRLAKEIMARYDNPYLVYARSPADFDLSRRLFEKNSGLKTETVQQYSLADLMRQETAGKPEF